jgi:Thioredoxin-like
MWQQWIAVALLILTFAAGVRSEEWGTPVQKYARAIHWHRDMQTARLTARATNRPLLLVFADGRCEHCRRLDALTLAHPEIVDAIERSFVPVRLDLESGAHAVDVLGVSALPTSVVLSPRADLLGRAVGYVDGHQYYALLTASRRLHQRIDEQDAASDITRNLPARTLRRP